MFKERKREIHLIAVEEVYIVERLFSSSLLAVVAKASPRKLRVCHFLKGAEICTYSHASRILAVKMNRDVRIAYYLW